MSENAVVVCDPEGIYLYHIPEASSTEGSTLKTVWEWLGYSNWFYGGVYTTYPQRPILYLQGFLETHTITFRVEDSGRDPVVAEHRIREDLSALERDYGRFVMKGRKVLYYDEDCDTIEFTTCLLGREELVGGFSAEIVRDDEWDDHEVKFVDFDGRTGRILMGMHRRESYGRGGVTRIYLADLPP